MPDAKSDHEPPLVERWLQEQPEWQRTRRTYVAAMALFVLGVVVLTIETAIPLLVALRVFRRRDW